MKNNRILSNGSPGLHRHLILFDFDGTLVNTTPLILRSFHATWQELFGFSFTDDVYIRTFGMLIHSAFRDLILLAVTEGRMKMPHDMEDACSRILPVYRGYNLGWHDEMIEQFAGVEPLLKNLKSRGHRLGVVSSKIRAGVERGLNLFAMAGFFDCLIGAEDVINHKPHPEPLLRAAELMNGSPRQTLYVGDSIHDVAAGRAAGMTTVAVSWGPFPRLDLENALPDYLLEQPEDLLEILD
ncbi:MAG: HAD-IA family hydrolase [Acidobacteria bacterium]|nr:HAD-IA family hydrolase [Acidobacteriota bacterium]